MSGVVFLREEVRCYDKQGYTSYVAPDALGLGKDSLVVEQSLNAIRMHFNS